MAISSPEMMFVPVVATVSRRGQREDVVVLDDSRHRAIKSSKGKGFVVNSIPR